jgi:acetyl-CoA carboxylase biotin carboxylase subunit
MPSPGKITVYRPPGGFGVRVDSAVYSGYEISPFYDSLVAKVIVWGKTRQDAIERMKRALGEFAIEGIQTTIPFHQRLLEHEVFLSGDFNTGFLDHYNVNL